MDFFAGQDYSVECCPYRDDLTRRRRKIWFTVSYDTPSLDIETCQMSLKYDRWRNPDRPGELPQTRRRWLGGSPARYETALGHYCGTPEQWLDGALTTDTPQFINPDTHAPYCCPASRLLIGGEAEGGVTRIGSGVAPSAGGEAEGGASKRAGGPFLAAGGEAEGGRSIPSGERYISYGGEAEGGTASARIKSAARGGIKFGGQAVDKPSVPLLPKGGTRIGGSAAAAVGILEQAKGGTRIGGSAAAAVGILEQAQGGVAVAGQAVDKPSVPLLPKGGTRIGGSAAAAVGILEQAQGGYKVGGSATSLLLPALLPKGGLELGGKAIDKSTRPEKAQGGGSGGGSPTSSKTP